MPPKLPPLWQCPKCGERFVTKNMWHSCGKFTLEALFARSEPHVFQYDVGGQKHLKGTIKPKRAPVARASKGYKETGPSSLSKRGQT